MLRLLFAVVICIVEFLLIALAINNIDPRMFGTGMAVVPIAIPCAIILSVLVFIRPLPRWVSHISVTIGNILFMGLLVFIGVYFRANPYAIFYGGRFDSNQMMIVIESKLVFCCAFVIYISVMQLLGKLLNQPIVAREVILVVIPAVVIITELILLTINISKIHIVT